MRISQRRSGSPVKPGRTSSVLLAALAVLTATTASSCSSSNSASTSGTTLTVLTSWTTDPEKGAFQDIVDAFERVNPTITVIPQPTRSLAAALQSDVQQGTTPDLAVMPDAGTLRDYAAEGLLQPLDSLADSDVSKTLPAQLRSDYGRLWNNIVSVTQGKTHPYAVPVKVSLKSLIWYDRRELGAESAPTWNSLMALGSSIARTASPWCLALADPPSSGWPGTDWIEDILLHQSGPDVYDKWVQGKIDWTSPQVASAFQTWGDIVAKSSQVYGSAVTALLTNYGSGDNPMFANGKSPQCLLGHGALVPTGPTALTSGTDYDFLDFPGFGAAPRQPDYEVSGDLMGVFHDSPAADAFIAFVAGAGAQTIWPTAQSEQAFSANKQATNKLQASLYAKDKVASGIDARLTNPNAILCFDASDLMPSAMTNAFYRAVLQYVQDPGLLHQILQNLDTVQTGAYAADSSSATAPSPPTACGTN